ncbi:hypothetical protein Cni_G05472 [Canna indica]|uniref:Uncharacterized protein n=1 Tax=Canna indica TaxID=4628 RepID=A0AAQ3Q3A1_9LILI|nr:hypothetical protein Cni_G05472 [Canna indica]
MTKREAILSNGDLLTMLLESYTLRFVYLKSDTMEVDLHGATTEFGLKRISVKLDMAYINWNWTKVFSKNSVHHLCKIASDHKPIILTAENENGVRKKRDFLFEQFWFDYTEVEQIIKDY